MNSPNDRICVRLCVFGGVCWGAAAAATILLLDPRWLTDSSPVGLAERNALAILGACAGAIAGFTVGLLCLGFVIFALRNADQSAAARWIVPRVTATVGVLVAATLTHTLLTNRPPRIDLLASGSALALVAWAFAARRVAPPVDPEAHPCPGCGFDLRGSLASIACPECGRIRECRSGRNDAARQ